MNWFKKSAQKSRFDNWISCYHSALYRHALWMTGNAETAADMVQETYYQAWSSLSQLQDNERALPWLLTILRRSVYKEFRYQYRNQETLNQLENGKEINGKDNSHSLLDIYELFENLSANQRDTFLLYALHGFTYEEISQQLDIPIGTVMSRISRAKKTLIAINNRDNNNVVDLQEIRDGKTS